jgi:hypothetical protein
MKFVIFKIFKIINYFFFIIFKTNSMQIKTATVFK